MIFADGFESPAPPAPPPFRPVLVAQSHNWHPPDIDWTSIASVRDYLRPPVDADSRFCLPIATRPRWDSPARPEWDAAMEISECVFGFDEFDQQGHDINWLDHVYSTLPDDILLACNGACGAFPGRPTDRTGEDIPVFPERCDVWMCTPQYDSAFLPPLEELKALAVAQGKRIGIWIDAYLPQEWGTCVSYSCTQSYERVKMVKMRQIMERYWDDPAVWGFDIFIGKKPKNTPSDSRDLRWFPNMRAYLESFIGEKRLQHESGSDAPE